MVSMIMGVQNQVFTTQRLASHEPSVLSQRFGVPDPAASRRSRAAYHCSSEPTRASSGAGRFHPV